MPGAPPGKGEAWIWPHGSQKSTQRSSREPSSLELDIAVVLISVFIHGDTLNWKKENLKRK